MLLVSGCQIYNPSIIFKTPKDYVFAKDTTSGKINEYKISEYDQLDIHIYTNDGFKLVDVSAATSSSSGTGAGGASVHYNVENDGAAKLPLLGKQPLKGMTLREAENFLGEKYKMYYKDPFIMMDVINRKVTVFRGDGSTATVLEIHNENITVFEAIARAGGIAGTGKAYKIKLLRGNLSNPEIYLIDFSTMKGIKQGNMTVQANDIIYVEPTKNIDQKVLTQLSTIVAIFTSALIVYDIVQGK